MSVSEHKINRRRRYACCFVAALVLVPRLAVAGPASGIGAIAGMASRAAHVVVTGGFGERPATATAPQAGPSSTGGASAQAAGPPQGLSPADGDAGYAADDAVDEGVNFDGADSVQADLALDDLHLGSLIEFRVIRGGLAQWYEAKRALNERYGLQLQVSYQSLHQWDDASPDDSDAAAGRLEFQGSWTALGRDGANPGSVSFRAEYRDELGENIPPSQVGLQIGSLSIPGTGFSAFGGVLSELAWNQTLLDGRFKFAVGKISATSRYNGHALSAPKRGFQNSAMQSSASKPGPGRGIGLAAGFRLTESTGFVGGIHDANARTQENAFDSIDQGEFFQTIEFRWIPTSFDRRRWDQVRVQYWHQDERKEAGVPASQGVTFLGSVMIGDRWMPFAFGGVSDGEASTMKADFGAGVGIVFNTAHRAARDTLGFAFNWGNPSNDSLRDEYNYEFFYRLQLIPHLALTPSAQYVHHPANNPEVDSVWVLGLRLRVTL